MAKEFAKRFYSSKSWIETRNAYFTEKDGLCELCGKAGAEVHHRKRLTISNINDPETALGWDNLQLLCRDCHFAIHDKAKNLRRKPDNRPQRYAFDENGQPVPNGRAVIVWGAPASGKSAYISEHMSHGDIVIDLDRIIECFTGIDPHKGESGATRHYLTFAQGIRDSAYKLAAKDECGIATAWVAVGLPTRKERAELASRLNARLVRIDTGREECLRRMEADAQRPDKQRWRNIINSYFERLEA